MGPVWCIKAKFGKWRKQGLFLESAEGLLRIEDGAGLGARASANGCRILAFVQKGDFWAKKREKAGAMIIDICKPGEFE